MKNVALNDAFRERFHAEPQFLAEAPGRTELGGNHTDHQNGKVLAAAIGRKVYAAVRPTGEKKITVVSEGFPPFSVETDALERRETEKETSAGLVRGVAAAFAREGTEIPGFEAVVFSEIPAGKGLSSSAAFEVLIARIINRLGNFGKTPPELAVMARYAENVYYGKPCGLMDQMTSAIGGTICIDFGSTPPKITEVPFCPEKFGYTLVLAETKAGHADLTGDYAAIPAELKQISRHFGKEVLRDVPEKAFLKEQTKLETQYGIRAVHRAQHVYAENRRVDAQTKALVCGDFPAFLALVKASGESSERLLENIIPSDRTRTEMSDALAFVKEILHGEGAVRVHGGGFAGCIQAYVPTGRLPAFIKKAEAVLGEGSCLQLSFS